ncbi:hypothetical protein, partial [Providencia stuartii]
KSPKTPLYIKFIMRTIRYNSKHDKSLLAIILFTIKKESFCSITLRGTDKQIAKYQKYLKEFINLHLNNGEAQCKPSMPI